MRGIVSLPFDFRVLLETFECIILNVKRNEEK